MRFNDTEKKLLKLALDPRAGAGEVDNAAVALIRSLRRRFKDGHAALENVIEINPLAVEGLTQEEADAFAQQQAMFYDALFRMMRTNEPPAPPERPVKWVPRRGYKGPHPPSQDRAKINSKAKGRG
jgi:hypothetical protein